MQAIVPSDDVAEVGFLVEWRAACLCLADIISISQERLFPDKPFIYAATVTGVSKATQPQVLSFPHLLACLRCSLPGHPWTITISTTAKNTTNTNTTTVTISIIVTISITTTVTTPSQKNPPGLCICGLSSWSHFQVADQWWSVTSYLSYQPKVHVKYLGAVCSGVPCNLHGESGCLYDTKERISRLLRWWWR